MTDQRKRYHIYRPAETKFLLIAYSQARKLVADNLNILSLPYGIISDAYNFFPNDQQYELIVLLIGGNDLFSGCFPSNKPPSQVAQEVHPLAKFVAPRTNKIFAPGIPELDKTRSTQRKLTTSWSLWQREFLEWSQNFLEKNQECSELR